MVLPEGFALPPLPYLLPLLVAVGVVGGLLGRAGPRISERTVLSFAPWILVGSSLHVLYVVETLPDAIRPLFGTPAVYLTTFVVAGAVWLAALRAVGPLADRSPLAVVGATGVATALSVVAVALWYGVRADALRVFWPFMALVAAIVLTGALWTGTRYALPDVATATNAVGTLVVFGHALDAVSTAVGVDVLGFGERTPASRIIMEFAGTLPTADALGVGWLFVVVKLVVAELVVVLFADYVTEDPAEGFLLLGGVAAVGLGPGAHNLLLFAITG